MRDVYVVGVGHTPFGKFLDRNIKSLTAEAVGSALQDGGIDKKCLQAAFFGNSLQGLVTGQEMIRGEVALMPLGIEAIPIVNCENACATGSTAFFLGWQAVSGGHADVVLTVGAEKLYMEDAARMFKNYEAGMDVEALENLRKGWTGEGEKPDGKPSGGGMRTVAMDMYGGFCRLHMDAFGTTQEDIAIVAAKNHTHSVNSPYAQFRKAMTVEEVLNARPVVYPLTVPMCAPIGDGAAAAVLCSKEFLGRLASCRPIKVLGCILGSHTNRPRGFGPDHIASRLSNKVYDLAGVGPKDIDVLELHDASSMGEIIELEAMGFCEWGQAAALARSGATTIGGRIPVNVSGGLVSKGHPLGATGLGQIFEIVTQLRGEAGKRQVEGARIGMTENGGGFVGVEEASMVLTILGRT